MFPRLVPFVLLFLLGGCTCGKPSCDPDKLQRSCEGEVMVFCQGQKTFGIDFGTYVQRTPCDFKNVCHDFGGGAVGCVHPPATRCDPETWVGGCDGDVPLVCTAPSSFVTESWVIGTTPCARGERCVQTPQGGDCQR